MARKKAWSGWGRPMQRVAGWDFDHRLNGYVTTAADRFACECGDEFDTPSGYRKCGSCGRAWNSYVIGTDGHGREASLERVICREIPVRKGVIVASKRRRIADGEGGDFGYAFDTPPKKRDKAELFADDESGTLGKVSRRRRAKDDGECTCWEGYERVPGTKPCAKGSCRKKAALRYVAWCRQVGRRPSPAGLRRFRVAERIVRTAQFRTAADEPFRDVEYSPGVWRGIHHHYPYPDRIPHIYDYEQFRRDNPDWFNPDGSPNPPPMRDSNPWSPSSRKLAPPMNMSPRSRYQAPNVHPEYGWINDVYRRLSEDEIKQHWPEVPRDQWTGYPGVVKFPGNEYHEPTYYSAGMAADPGLYKVYEPGWETGVAPQKSKPSVMPRKIKPRPGDPSSAESGLTLAKRRHADRHNLRRKDLAELEAEQEPEEDVSIEHFSSRRTAASYEDWAREKGYKPGGPHDENERMHWHYDTGTGDPEDWEGVPKEWGEFNNWKPKKKAIRRRRAELFDITEEGETRKGKGKTDTPTMRKNPKDWTDRRQNGQYTKRWN